MAENRRGKRFYFSRGQLILLGCGFTAAAVIIFLLGMLVGKGIEEGKMVKPAEPLVKIPVKPSQGPNSAPASPPKEELTFYDTLTSAPARPSPSEDKSREAKRVNSVARVVTEESKPHQVPTQPARKPVGEPAEPPGKGPPTETVEKKEAGGIWTVQVNAFPDQNSAKVWVDRLKNKGYNAYVTEVQNKGKVWYRVRVGHYDTREEAETIEDTLKNKENLTKAFATSR